MVRRGNFVVSHIPPAAGSFSTSSTRPNPRFLSAPRAERPAAPPPSTRTRSGALVAAPARAGTRQNSSNSAEGTPETVIARRPPRDPRYLRSERIAERHRIATHDCAGEQPYSASTNEDSSY